MNPPKYEGDFPITLGQVALLCEVEAATTRVWRTRGVLPPSDVPESPEPLWWVSTIADWATTVGRNFDLDALKRNAAANVEREASRPCSPRESWRQRPVWRGGLAMAEPADTSGLGRPLVARDTSDQGLCAEPI